MDEVTPFPCPCCQFLTLSKAPPGTYDICPVCNWEDDPVQFYDPEFKGGANEVSLSAARKNLQTFGSSCKEGLGSVREPLAAEIPQKGDT